MTHETNETNVAPCWLSVHLSYLPVLPVSPGVSQTVAAAEAAAEAAAVAAAEAAAVATAEAATDHWSVRERRPHKGSGAVGQRSAVSQGSSGNRWGGDGGGSVGDRRGRDSGSSVRDRGGGVRDGRSGYRRCGGVGYGGSGDGRSCVGDGRSGERGGVWRQTTRKQAWFGFGGGDGQKSWEDDLKWKEKMKEIVRGHKDTLCCWSTKDWGLWLSSYLKNWEYRKLWGVITKMEQ